MKIYKLPWCFVLTRNGAASCGIVPINDEFARFLLAVVNRANSSYITARQGATLVKFTVQRSADISACTCNIIIPDDD